MSSFFRSRPAALAAGLAATILLTGCEALGRNEQTVATVQSRVAGLSAGDFFERYGKPRTRDEKLDRSTQYVWESIRRSSAPALATIDERVCRLRLQVDPRGRITEVDVMFDDPGYNGPSRCREIIGGAP